MLALAVASNLNFAFLHIQASDIKSNWICGSERYAKELFDYANFLRPAIIFIGKFIKSVFYNTIILQLRFDFADEIESLFGRRGTGYESEHAQSLSNELLVATVRYPGVTVIGATNYPWQIDPSFLRRLPIRCFISLPTEAERIQLFKNKLRVIYILSSV